MERRLTIVTGATGGIGRAICARLIADGYMVIAQYRRNKEAASALTRELDPAGEHLTFVAADLYSHAGVKLVVDAAQEILDRNSDVIIRGLVNNAGVLLGPSFFDATPESFDRYFALNTRAPFFLSQGVVPLMSEGGSIVNVSSAGAHFSSPGDIIYAMSKSAVESLTRNMAEAIAPLGLRVNTVIPGFTDNGHPAFQNETALEYMGGFSVLGGVSEPGDVAEAVSFLLSDRSRRTTGAAVDVSGGSTLAARGARAGTVGHIVRGLVGDL